MPTLLEKLRALAETEKQATEGPWEANNKFGESYEVKPAEIWLGECSSLPSGHAKANATLIADSRTLLKELLESWFAQHEALENLIDKCRVHQTAPPDYAWSECICGREDHHEPDCPVEAARKALNLATTPHP